MSEKWILLIEDEPTTREILTYLLRQAGYAVDTVGSAGAATTCLDGIPYALVIADWFLPDGNGADLADAAAERGSKTLVISDLVLDLPRRAARGHELLPKRVGHPAILAAVQRAIGQPCLHPQRQDDEAAGLADFRDGSEAEFALRAANPR